MLRCSCAALSTNTAVVAAAIARPTRTRCQRAHRERKRSSAAHVSTVGTSGRERADFKKTSFRTLCKNYSWLQYKKRQIQAPGTTFSTCSDEVSMEGGHGNCCQFATLTGVHQTRTPYLPCEILDQRKNSELEQDDEYPLGKFER